MINKFKNLNLQLLSQLIILIFLSSLILKDIFIISIFRFKLDLQDLTSLTIISLFFIFYLKKKIFTNFDIKYGFLCLSFLFLILISALNNSSYNIGVIVFIISSMITLLISYSLKIRELFNLIKYLIFYFGFINFLYFLIQIFFSTFNGIELNQYGFFKERLFFISILTLVYSIKIKEIKDFKAITMFSIILLATAVYTGSLTGIILVLVTILISNIIDHKRLILFLIIFSILGIIIFPQHTISKVPKITKIISLLIYNNEEDQNIMLHDRFWRFRSTVYTINEFKSSPKFLGHGYQSHAKILMNDFLNYSEMNDKSKNEKKLTTHTFPLIIYDQGVLAFILFITILLFPIYQFKIYKVLNQNNNFLIILFITILLHSCLYYQGKPNLFYFLYFMIFFNKDLIKE